MAEAPKPLYKQLTNEGRNLVMKVHDFLLEEKETRSTISIDKVQERTAAACDVSISTVQRLLRYRREHGTTDKLPLQRCSNLSKDLPPEIKEQIRTEVYDLYKNKEFVTISLLSNVLREKQILDVSNTTLRKIMLDLGFRYKKIDNRKVLCEMSHIVSKRWSFLRRYIENADSERPRILVFLDETWIFSKGGEKRSWQDGSIHCYQQPTKANNGKRFMIIHAGGDMGFVKDAGKVFSTNNVSSDYHDSMDSQYFENWFENDVLKRLEEPALIILDNASYHSRILNKTPNGSWRKNEIATWLQSQNIALTGNELKAELLNLSRHAAHGIKTLYAVDEMALTYGHEVLRLPPYHCHFNAIEMVWGVAKVYYDKNVAKISGSVDSVCNLWEEALQQIPDEKWPNFVSHTDKIIRKAYIQEIVVDEIRPLIFTVNTGESDEENDFEDE